MVAPATRFALEGGDRVRNLWRDATNGVNVAARLEGLAEPGGVCVSGTAHEQIRDKLPYLFEDQGEQAVKNIARPLRVFALSADSVARLPVLSEKSAAAPSSRFGQIWTGAALVLLLMAGSAATLLWLHRNSTAPQLSPTATVGTTAAPAIAQSAAVPNLSIVVLPFEKLSNDPEQDYFAEGLNQDVTTDLYRIPNSFVIAPVEAALRLSPRDPLRNIWMFFMCHAYTHLVQDDKAIEWCQKSVAIAPWWFAYIDLASAYAWKGESNEAHNAVQELLKLVPGYTVRKLAVEDWSDEPAFVKQYARIVEGLRKAGLPE